MHSTFRLDQLDDLAVLCLQGCRERVVFDAVERWAYGCAPLCGSQLVQNLADVEGLLLLIRFPLMSQTELEARSDIPPVKLNLSYLQCLQKSFSALYLWP